MLLTVLFACKKYDQDYTNNKIDEIGISTSVADGRYILELGATLEIDPIIKESSPGQDEFSYEWRLLEQTTPKTYLLSNERKLSAKVEVPVGTYYLGFKMKNKRTGQFFTYQGMVYVISKYNAGYYITSNVGGQGKLSFLRLSDNQLSHAVPELVNTGKTYPGRALHADNYGNLLYYFTDQGIYRFTANDFMEIARNAEVIDGNKKFKKAPIGFSGGASDWDAFMIGDGDVHAGIGTNMASVYGNQLLNTPFSPRLVGDYDLYSGVFPTSATALFYDNKHQRFMQCASTSRDLVVYATAPGSFNLSDVKMTMIAGGLGRVAREYYYLMENSAGTRYLMTTSNGAPGILQVMDNSPDLNTANLIVASALVKHLYYASGNKLYLYDIPANTSRLVYTFSSTDVIKDMKMDRSTSKRLVIGVSKNANEGEVYYFDLDNLGNIVNNAPVSTFTGFGDIVSVNLR